MFILVIGLAVASLAWLVHVVCARQADGIVRAAAEVTTLAGVATGVGAVAFLTASALEARDVRGRRDSPV